MGSIKNVLSQSAFWQVNKIISKKLNSIESALLLSDLIDKQSYYENRNELIIIDKIEYFFATSEQIEDNTTLTYKVQKKCIKILKEHGLIETKLSGVPAKLHFTLCENKIWHLVNSSIAQKSKLVLPKSQTNNNTVNNNTEIINSIKEFSKNNLLFPEQDIEKESIFIESLVFDENVWNNLFKKEIELKIDVMYYHQSVWNWNEKLPKKDKRKKRTARGWIATAKDFIRSDNDNGKLKTINSNQIGLDQSQIDYLKL